MKVLNLPITKEQIRSIKSLQSALGLEDGEYRAALRTLFAKDSCKELTAHEARQFISTLQDCDRLRRNSRSPLRRQKNVGPLKFEELGKRPGLASPAQLRLIEAQWRQITVAVGDEAQDAALRAFLERHFNRFHLYQIESSLVGKILHVFKTMKAQQSSHKSKSNGSSKESPAGEGASTPAISKAV